MNISIDCIIFYFSDWDQDEHDLESDNDTEYYAEDEADTEGNFIAFSLSHIERSFLLYFYS